MKAFAAAGINNRTVLLLDNDAAAHDAQRGLNKTQLPSHYATGHYPHLPAAVAYPTIGGTGSQISDVNGAGGSIELYLGRDVLTDPRTNELTQVRWTAFIPAVQKYQAEVADKAAAQQAFRAKVAAARQNPEIMASQDWEGMDLVIERLLALVKRCTVPVPGFAGRGLV